MIIRQSFSEIAFGQALNVLMLIFQRNLVLRERNYIEELIRAAKMLA